METFYYFCFDEFAVQSKYGLENLNLLQLMILYANCECVAIKEACLRPR